MTKKLIDPYDNAYSEMMKDNPDEELAFSLLKQAHEAGDARATYAIATWYLFGQKGIVKKNLKKAILFLKESAVKKNPDAMFDLAICYEKGAGVKKDLEAAFELYLGAALRNDNKSVQEVGRCYFFGIGVKKDERVAEIWYERSNELGVSEEAIEACDKAIAIKPDDAIVWNNKGVALSDLGKYEEAINAYEKALEIKPDYQETWSNKGDALSNLGKYEEAKEAYDKAIEIKTDDHEVWYNKGDALTNLGKYEEAKEAY